MPRGELGSLEEAVTDCTEPSPAASSLGSWADECERADAALAAAEAQMGRGCGEENPEGAAALNGDLLMEEDGEWMVALKEALAPRPAVAGGDGGPAKGPAEGHQSRPRAAADQRGPEEAGASRGEGDRGPHRGRGRHPGVRRQEETSPP